jgi:hypothetical protein
MQDMTCVPFTPIHYHPSETISLDIRPHGISPNSPAIRQRRLKRSLRWPRQWRGHQPPLGRGVVNGMKPTTMIALLADDKDSDEDGPGGPKKRGKPSVTRVQGEAASTKRTCRPPVIRTQQRKIDRISKAAGHGAERLGSTTARGVYHRSLLGLSVPQGSVGVLGHELPSWIVGREQVETQRETGSLAPQQISLQENAEDGEDLHQIPGNLSERERSMLQMTQDERERGAVGTIKCKLCPDAQLGAWVTFQRHCNACEKHPLELHFCPRCGDHFARSDSRNRHYKRKDEACRNMSPHDGMEKTEKVERLFEAFDARLTHCLKSGEKIWPMFSDAASKILKNTSKKVSKTEETFESLEGTWAAGLC